ncbi:MAG: Mur ligase family protein, partial [Candidatus Omnitrophota bacterium]
MTYTEALHYLDSFINYEKQDAYDYRSSLDLERVKRFIRLLGDPHKGIKSIHIAGSKGKGSTAAFVHSILKEAGLRTGLYTSPHLISFRERIRINDTLISEDDIAKLSGKLKNVIDGMEKEDIPSFFEVYTALCHMYFKEQKVDIAVYEVGMGGRLDATNVIDPLVSAITPVSYEHTQKLGPTLSRIAMEKGGIIKENTVCVSAPQEEEALNSINEICVGKSAKLVLVG